MTPSIVTFTGPSGVGKSSIRRVLQDDSPDHFVIVPMVTTRAPKEGDREEYEYVSPDAFLQSSEAGAFVASTRVPGTEDRCYAYRHDAIQYILDNDLHPLLVTDESLLQQLFSSYGRPHIFSIGVVPPGDSFSEMHTVLLERLSRRGRDTESEIADRLRNAENDILLLKNHPELWDQSIVNDDLAATARLIRACALENALS